MIREASSVTACDPAYSVELPASAPLSVSSLELKPGGDVIRCSEASHSTSPTYWENIKVSAEGLTVDVDVAGMTVGVHVASSIGQDNWELMVTSVSAEGSTVDVDVEVRRVGVHIATSVG